MRKGGADLLRPAPIRTAASPQRDAERDEREERHRQPKDCACERGVRQRSVVESVGEEKQVLHVSSYGRRSLTGPWLAEGRRGVTVRT